jgi:hypothetical protein
MVVWSCRGQLKEMNACMAAHKTPEEVEKYRAMRESEMEVAAAETK